MKLVRHTLLNLAGLGLPLLVAVVSIPQLLLLLGTARFGLLTLVWAVVSYFGLFDLGLGRALTQRLSQSMRADPAADPTPVIGTALLLMMGISALAAMAMAALSPVAVDWIQGVPDRAEALRALLVMSLAVPSVVLAAGLRGVLEAHLAFGWVNALRIPLGLYTFAAPWAVAHFVGPRLDLIAMALLFGRLAALAAHYVAARYVIQTGRIALVWRRTEVRPLLTMGGWLTVGTLIGPLMGYADRFIIASAVSAAAVAYYVTPNELITKLWIVPGALTTVLFPAFAATAGRHDSQSRQLAQQGLTWLFVVLLPVTLGLALFSFEVLSLWIGPSFAAESAPVMRLMALGILINCMAHVPLTQLQGAGNAQGPALLQLFQLAPYIGLLWWSSTHFGVIGAAAVWTARMVLDTSALFWLNAKQHREQPTAGVPARGTTLVLVAACCAFGGAFISLPVGTRALIWLGAGVYAALALHPWRGHAGTPALGSAS